MTATSYEKRVKRRIVGREHDFFAVCSPGLRRVCHHEMRAHGFPGNHLKLDHGGVEFKGKLNDCMLFNLNLRSPSRILLRISRFRADSFQKLEKKINAIDWILYLPENCSLKFKVTTRKSRLYHSDAIAQRCEKIILDQLRSENGITCRTKPNQTVYIRADHDEFTISLDSTGDLLFKRGLKKKVTQAPLRENLAFAMLHWAGFSKEDILIDPMCGSGTFSIEAAMIKSNLPPGFFRSFAFETWPGFSQKTFAFNKRQAKEKFVTYSKKEIFASDVDDSALSAMEQNILDPDLQSLIAVSKKDFFSTQLSDISPEISLKGKRVIVLNPPYGKRLGEKNNTKQFYQEIGNKLAADFKGCRLGIILPSRECKSYLGLKLELKPILHGGLEIFAGIGTL